MSVQAVAWVLESSPTRLGPRLVLLSIANHAKADGTGAWPSYETIGQEAGLTRRHAYRIMAELEAAGHIAVGRKEGPKGTNLYSIVGMATRDNLSPDISDSEDQNQQLGTNPQSARDKSDAARDKSGTESVENVPRTVIEPSLEPSKPKSLAVSPLANGKMAERVALKNAIVKACEWSLTDMTSSLWGRVESAAKELHDIDADPEDIDREAYAWRHAHPDIPVTPQVLATHFAEWAAGNLRPKKAGRR